MEAAERHQGRFEGVVGQMRWTTDACHYGDLYAVVDIQDGRTFMCVNRKHSPSTADQPIDSAKQAELIEADLSATVRHRPQHHKSPSTPAVVIPSFPKEMGSSGLKYFTNLSLIAYGSVLLGFISLAIIGGISGFKEGHSTHA
jgi:hypothetical protein